MKHNLLPIHQTGWLYLLLAVWGGLLWFSYQGGFNWLNQFNRERLYEFMPQNQPLDSVLRIDAELDKQNISLLKQILTHYPDTPVVLLGEPTGDLITQLQTELVDLSRSAKVIVATQAMNSSKALYRDTQNPDLLEQGIDWFRYAEPEQIRWRESAQLVFTPLGDDSRDGLYAVWRNQENLYLTLIGEVIRQSVLGQGAQFQAGWDIEFSSTKQRWPLGLLGKVYSAGPISMSQSIGDFAEQPVNDKLQLIIVDDLSLANGIQIAQTTQGMLQGQYWYQSLLTVLLQWSLVIIGLLLVWWLKIFKLSTQLIAIFVFVMALWGLQYLLFTQYQWLAVTPLVITFMLSWLVILGYRRETQVIDNLNQRHNQLLGDALPVFFESQNIDKLQPLLMQTQPDIKLADKVFDIALRAEADNNKALAKNLLTWIQESPIPHPESDNKLLEMNQQNEQLSLDGTMVIEPGKTTNSAMNAVYQVDNFGRYQVEGILGRGAMGIVYQGVDPKINRHVAIKTLHLADDFDDENLNQTKQRFFREAETAGNLSHANIVTIYDVGEEGQLGYIAMDLLTGAPLSEFVKPEHRLPAPLIYQLMIQITDALDYAHKQNVVHRDIKPGNIIFDDEVQRVTITDFGIAYVSDNSKTRTGTIMGSPYYMSPEQVLGKRVDGRSDIFSLGVTFYQLLSGQLPFNGESIASVAYHITKTKQTSVRQWDSKLPASAARITNKALQKDVGKRYQDMQEFKQALISALKRDFKKVPIV